MPALYNRIGNKYDTTRKADPEILHTLSGFLEIADGKKYLDVACGTGNYTIDLQKLGGRWFAFDVSVKMVEEARAKSDKLVWHLADVEKLPFENDVFDGAVCILAIHHFSCLEASLKEIGRILKINSPFVAFTATQEQMRGYWLNHYFPDALRKSVVQMPSLELIQESLQRSNFRIIETRNFFISHKLQDFFLYSGKQRPEMYLSEKIRRGMSTFANLAEPDEVEEGVNLLHKDIESGRINSVISKFENNFGDYLFIKSERI